MTLTVYARRDGVLLALPAAYAATLTVRASGVGGNASYATARVIGV